MTRDFGSTVLNFHGLTEVVMLVENSPVYVLSRTSMWHKSGECIGADGLHREDREGQVGIGRSMAQ